MSLTGFKIPILELPFERGIKLTDDKIKIIRRSFMNFSPKMLILLDQSSSHSMILKQREKCLFMENLMFNKKLYKKDETIF